MIAGTARLYSHKIVLAEKTIILLEFAIALIVNHLSKTTTHIGPLTAISVTVMKGIIVMMKYVIIIGISVLKYESLMPDALTSNTNCNE